jgi:signal transduction histidine kinase
MKKLFNKLNIKEKIFLALLIPMATIIITSVFSFLEKKESIDRLDYFHIYYQYYQKIGDIINDIEIERSLAFSYIGSDGDKTDKESLNIQRVIIDNRFKNLNSFFQTNKEVFDEKLVKLVNHNFDQLEIFRYNVDRLNLFLDIEQNFYTDLIYNLLYSASNIPAMTNNKYLSNQTLAYKHLIEAKEYLSLKVGLLKYAIKSKNLTIKDIQKLKHFNEFYKTNLMMFKYFVNNDLKKEFIGAQMSQYYSSIKMQNKLNKLPIIIKNDLKKPRDINKIKVDIKDIKLDQFSDNLLIKIDIIKGIENKLALDILKTIKKEKEKFYKNLMVYISSILFIILLVSSFGFMISKNLVRKILVLEEGLISFLKYVKREEKKFKPIVLKGNDEINHMANIVNDSIKETAYYVELEVKKAKKLHIQMMEAEKMAQMGEMIGNIAHQWRQPLSIISTLATGIAVKKEFKQDIKDSELIAKMDSINRYTQYLSETINTFRDFIKEKKELKKQTLQSNVKSALGIVSAVLRDVSIELIDEINYDDKIELEMVSGELPQVIINIINNAKDVIISKQINDGWIKLDLKRYEAKAVLTIEDNGGGIPQKIKGKIFDPYFTTKHKSQGTGLGLHMSYRIVTESLHGKIYVKNTQNGAKFYIEIPL